MTPSFSSTTRILVFSPYALWNFHTVYEGTIAKACRVRGAEVTYLLCDGLPECDQHWFSKTGSPRPADICQRCRASALTNVGPVEFPSRWISEFLNIEERAEVAAWAEELGPQEFATATFRGLRLGEWVLSSMNSYFRQFPPDLGSATVVEVYRNFLVSAGLVTVALTNYLDRNSIDSALLFNGRQSITRVAMEIFLARGIPVLTHERGEYQREHLNVRANAHCMSPLPFQSFWRAWGRIPLRRGELEQARMWLVQRRYGANLAWIPFSKAVGGKCVRQQLNLDPTKPLLALFTSSTDEVAGDPLMQGPYVSQSDWVRDVVAWAGNHSEVELVIKVHPNLGGNSYIGAATQELSIYEQMSSALPANVRMVMPYDNVSAYNLSDEADIGITFGSMVGLEMAMLGKPVVLASRAFYEHGLTFHTVRLREHLPTHLAKSLQMHDKREIQREAFRIAYYAVCVCDMPFAKVKVQGLYAARENFNGPSDLAPGKDPSLDAICRFLIDGGELFEPPSSADLARTSAEENAYFAELASAANSFREPRYEQWIRLRSIGRIAKHVLQRLPFGAGERILNLGRPGWHSMMNSLEAGKAGAHNK
jgi:hypothetical protein